MSLRLLALGRAATKFLRPRPGTRVVLDGIHRLEQPVPTWRMAWRGFASAPSSEKRGSPAEISSVMPGSFDVREKHSLRNLYNSIMQQHPNIRSRDRAELYSPTDERFDGLYLIPEPLSTDPGLRKLCFQLRKSQGDLVRESMRVFSFQRNQTFNFFKVVKALNGLEVLHADKNKEFVRDMLYLDKTIEAIPQHDAKLAARQDWCDIFSTWIMMHDYFFDTMQLAEEQTFRMKLLLYAVAPSYHIRIPGHEPEIPVLLGRNLSSVVKSPQFLRLVPLSPYDYGQHRQKSFRSVQSAEEDYFLASGKIMQKTNDVLAVRLPLTRVAYDCLMVQLCLPIDGIIDELVKVTVQAVTKILNYGDVHPDLCVPSVKQEIMEEFRKGALKNPNPYCADPSLTPLSYYPGTYADFEENFDKIEIEHQNILVCHIVSGRGETFSEELPDGSNPEERLAYCMLRCTLKLPAKHRSMFGDSVPGVPQEQMIAFDKVLMLRIRLPRTLKCEKPFEDFTKEPLKACISEIYDPSNLTAIRQRVCALYEDTIGGVDFQNPYYKWLERRLNAKEDAESHGNDTKTEVPQEGNI